MRMPQPELQTRPVDARQAARQELLGGLLRSTGRVRLEVAGASMLPAIWPGDRVTVQECGLGDLHAGDLVSFWLGSFLVTHRVESVRGEWIQTRGDSAPAVDPPVSAGDLLGRVVAIERGGRELSSARCLWHRVAAFVLRHSELCTRMLLHARARFAKSSSVVLNHSC